MFKSFIGEQVTFIVSSRGNNLLEYIGTLLNETNDTIELANVNISHLVSSFQKGMFGDNITKYKENLDRVIISKQYIISCNK